MIVDKKAQLSTNNNNRNNNILILFIKIKSKSRQVSPKLPLPFPLSRNEHNNYVNTDRLSVQWCIHFNKNISHNQNDNKNKNINHNICNNYNNSDKRNNFNNNKTSILSPSALLIALWRLWRVQTTSWSAEKGDEGREITKLIALYLHRWLMWGKRHRKEVWRIQNTSHHYVPQVPHTTITYHSTPPQHT